MQKKTEKSKKRKQLNINCQSKRRRPKTRKGRRRKKRRKKKKKTQKEEGRRKTPYLPVSPADKLQGLQKQPVARGALVRSRITSTDN